MHLSDACVALLDLAVMRVLGGHHFICVVLSWFDLVLL